MMEYNSEYIHFEQADGLIGKWCIAADSVFDIKSILASNNAYITSQLVQIKDTDDVCSFPFKVTGSDSKEPCPFKFVYIDPAFQDMMCNEEVLKWTDLKIGDIVRSKVNKDMLMLVQGIDKSANTSEHIFFNGVWKSDYDLANWEKVEE